MQEFLINRRLFPIDGNKSKALKLENTIVPTIPLPSFQGFLSPYKKSARVYAKHYTLKHVIGMNEYARRCHGYIDWNEFSGIIRGYHKSLKAINFTDAHWEIIFAETSYFDLFMTNVEKVKFFRKMTAELIRESCGLRSTGNPEYDSLWLKLNSMDNATAKAVYFRSLGYWGKHMPMIDNNPFPPLGYYLKEDEQAKERLIGACDWATDLPYDKPFLLALAEELKNDDHNTGEYPTL